MAVIHFPGPDSTTLSRLQKIKFRNDAGSTAPAFGILRVTGLVSTDPEEVFLTVGQSNVYGSQDGHAINMDLPVASGGYGYCTLGEMNVALYDGSDGTPAALEMWGPQSGSWKLRKSTGGFKVAGVISTDRKMVLVIPSPMLTVRGKPTGDVAAGASGTIDIYTGTFGSESQPSGNPTLSSVRNDSSCTVKGSQIATAAWVPDNNGWQFVTGRTS